MASVMAVTMAFISCEGNEPDGEKKPAMPHMGQEWGRGEARAGLPSLPWKALQINDLRKANFGLMYR